MIISHPNLDVIFYFIKCSHKLITISTAIKTIIIHSKSEEYLNILRFFHSSVHIVDIPRKTQVYQVNHDVNMFYILQIKFTYFLCCIFFIKINFPSFSKLHWNFRIFFNCFFNFLFKFFCVKILL